MITSSSADHWALAVYSRKIRPATAQLKSPGKLTTWIKRRGQERERERGVSDSVNVTGNQKKLRKKYNYLLVFACVKCLQGHKTKIHHYKVFVKACEMTERGQKGKMSKLNFFHLCIHFVRLTFFSSSPPEIAASHRWVHFTVTNKSHITAVWGWGVIAGTCTVNTK